MLLPCQNVTTLEGYSCDETLHDMQSWENVEVNYEDDIQKDDTFWMNDNQLISETDWQDSAVTNSHGKCLMISDVDADCFQDISDPLVLEAKLYATGSSECECEEELEDSCNHQWGSKVDVEHADVTSNDNYYCMKGPP